MRDYLFAATAVVALCALGVGGALAQYSTDSKYRWMKVKNESPFTALQIYIVPSKYRRERDCCWSRDLLEVEVIPPKSKNSGKASEKTQKNELYVNFDDGSGECEFDVRVTTQYHGWDWYFSGIDVCEKEKDNERVITLKGKRVITLDEIPDPTKIPDPKVKIRNASSGLIAYSVYIIRKGEDCCWSPDLLGKRLLIWEGTSLVVPFDDGRRECKKDEIREYDIRITSHKEGIDWYFDGVDVCDARNAKEGITLRGEKKDAKNRLLVKNESKFEAVNAYIVREGKRSADLLKAHTIRAREHLEVDFYDVDFAGCTFDVEITREDRGPAEWRFAGVNVCSGSELVLTAPQVPR